MDNNRQKNRQPQQIDFSSDAYIPREKPRATGLRDEDWEDDEFRTPARSRNAANRSFEQKHYQRRTSQGADAEIQQGDASAHNSTMNTTQYPNYGAQPPYQTAYPQPGHPSGHQTPYPQPEEEPEEPKNFVKRHPILMNLLYIIFTAVLLGWLAMFFLDLWTFHGQEAVVPDVRNQLLYSASNGISQTGLHSVVTDSIYDSYAKPGTVVEQVPVPGAKVKKGGTVYLTIVAFTPKMITVPDFYNVSERQARSLLEGLGIKEVRKVEIPSEYAGLVLGARYNGISLRPGARIPASAVVTIEVGTGLDALAEEGAPIDTAAIEEAVEQIETLDLE